jgi:hypothetical protein
VASQASTPSSSSSLSCCGAALPRTASAARAASAPSGRPCWSRTAAYCSSRPDRNSRGSSAPSATGTPASCSWRTGTSSTAPATPERHVRGRADLEDDPALGEQLHGPRVLDRPDPVPEAVRAQDLDGCLHRPGAAQLAGVGHRQQPGLAGDAERLGELLRTAARLVVRQAEADDPRAAAARLDEAPGDPGEGLGVARVPGAVGGHDQRHPDARGPGGLPHRVQHELDGRLQPAEPRRVRTRGPPAPRPRPSRPSARPRRSRGPAGAPRPRPRRRRGRRRTGAGSGTSPGGRSRPVARRTGRAARTGAGGPARRPARRASRGASRRPGGGAGAPWGAGPGRARPHPAVRGCAAARPRVGADGPSAHLGHWQA